LSGALAAVLGISSLPGAAHAQPDVADSARALCNQAVGIWESQDQWAVRQLSTIYTDALLTMSNEEFDESIRSSYARWASAFGVDRPCQADVPTVAAAGGITRTAWDTFNRCLQGGVDARRNAVETLVREHQILMQDVTLGTVNATMIEASQGHLTTLAQGSGVRSCRL
jgi:hypothetical protein